VDSLFPDTDYTVYVSALNSRGDKTARALLGTTHTGTGAAINSPAQLTVTRPVTGESDRLNLSWVDASGAPSAD
jgi:hypothetical protein